MHALHAAAQITVLSPGSLVTELGQNGTIPGATATFGAPLQKSPRRAGAIATEMTTNCEFRTPGADAVIIVDGEGLSREELQETTVADQTEDGANITIPTVVVTKDDGETLIRRINDGQEVLVRMAWGRQTDGGKVDVEAWLNAGSTQSWSFLKDFGPMRRRLNELMTFKLHFNIFSVGDDPVNIAKLCWKGEERKYCTEAPAGDASTGPLSGVTGGQVLEEVVLTLCIDERYELTHDSSFDQAPAGPPWRFWDFVEKYGERCATASAGSRKDCATALMTSVGIDAESMWTCVGENPEAKLDNQLNKRAWSPNALSINSFRYSGVKSADRVVRAICSSFPQQPVQCKELLAPKRHRDWTVLAMIGAGVALLLGISLVAVYIRGKRARQQAQAPLQQRLQELGAVQEAVSAEES